ncbi:LysR family transcriptional regulator substrate-binding protein [Effusibacillus consociatus]|uniref:LysR family transcriptional regulator substrate-binding protein n=1 Tax=Effusibacillus consociatus TaxID=1117041 RepID=A0ABV9PX62_9BACL
MKGERLILTGRNCAYRRKLEKILWERGNNVIPVIQTGSVEAVKQMVQKGLGIGIVPLAVTNPLPPGTVVKAAHDLELDVTIGLLQRRNEYVSRAMESLINSLQNSLQQA